MLKLLPSSFLKTKRIGTLAETVIQREMIMMMIPLTAIMAYYNPHIGNIRKLLLWPA